MELQEPYELLKGFEKSQAKQNKTKPNKDVLILTTGKKLVLYNVQPLRVCHVPLMFG